MIKKIRQLIHCNLLELFHLLFDSFFNKKIANETIVGLAVCL